MFCSKCGKQAEGEYCWNCGAKLYVPQGISTENNHSENPSEKKPAEKKERAPYTSFSPTASYSIAMGKFEIDSLHRMMRYVPKFSFDPSGSCFYFDDIIDAELIENGSSAFNTSTASMITRAAIGSIISGGMGVVAGVTAKRKEKQYITELYIRITLNDPSNPMVKIPFIAGKVARDSLAAETATTNIETVLSQIKIAQSSSADEAAWDSSWSGTALTWRCQYCGFDNPDWKLVCKRCEKVKPH